MYIKTNTSNIGPILQANTNTEYSLDELNSIGKDLCEGWTKDNGILSFAVLYHIIGKVEEIQAMIVVSWKKSIKKTR